MGVGRRNVNPKTFRWRGKSFMKSRQITKCSLVKAVPQQRVAGGQRPKVPLSTSIRDGFLMAKYRVCHQTQTCSLWEGATADLHMALACFAMLSGSLSKEMGSKKDSPCLPPSNTTHSTWPARQSELGPAVRLCLLYLEGISYSWGCGQPSHPWGSSGQGKRSEFNRAAF